MIKILYLYHDLMNLYGDNGNIRFLERCLTDQGLKVSIIRKTVSDDLSDLNEYDVIYCGSSLESNRNVCLKHLYQYKDVVKKAFDNNKVFLCTGNAYEMFGRHIDGLFNFSHDGIGLFDFTVKETSDTRFTADVIVNTDLFAEKCVGFINKCSTVNGNEKPLFRINGKVGITNSDTDGVHANNFFGTQLIGPVLVKNPYFARYFIWTILQSKNISEYREIEYPNAMKGYETTIRELSKDM